MKKKLAVLLTIVMVTMLYVPAMAVPVMASTGTGGIEFKDGAPIVTTPTVTNTNIQNHNIDFGTQTATAINATYPSTNARGPARPGSLAAGTDLEYFGIWFENNAAGNRSISVSIGQFQLVSTGAPTMNGFELDLNVVTDPLNPGYVDPSANPGWTGHAPSVTYSSTVGTGLTATGGAQKLIGNVDAYHNAGNNWVGALRVVGGTMLPGEAQAVLTIVINNTP